MRIELFNKQSFIEVVDATAMGNKGDNAGDLAVVDGARVSFGRRASEFTPEANEKLAKNLWDASDLSPYAKLVLQMRVRVPVHVALWWFLFPHAEYNEISGRYSKTLADDDRLFIPQDFSNDLTFQLQMEWMAGTEMYKRLYDWKKFDQGEKQVAKEMARASLLYSFSTEFIFTINLRKLIHFMMHFAHHPYFSGEINNAFLNIIKSYCPVFGTKLEQDWPYLVGEKGSWPEAKDISFATQEIGVLGDRHSAIKLQHVVGSDSALAELVRNSRGYRGNDYDVLKLLIQGSRKDDLPEELAHIRMDFWLKCPVYVLRQLYRHKRATWAGLKTYPNEFFIPQTWRAQKKDTRYSFDPFNDGENAMLSQMFEDYVKTQHNHYQLLLHNGVPDEQAERFLPYCFYVSILRMGDGIDLFNFFNMRCDTHAQEESRRYAMEALKHFAHYFPITFLVWYEEYWTGAGNKHNPLVDAMYKKVRQST